MKIRYQTDGPLRAERLHVMRYRRFAATILVIGGVAWTSRAGTTFNTIDVPGAAKGTSAAGIKARGQIVGSYADAAGHNLAFLLDHGTFTTIDFPGAACTQAIGINDRGQIVGVYYDSAGNHGHGFLLDDGTLTTIDVPGAPYTNAQGINNRGEIVGFYSYPTIGSLGFLLDYDRRLVACPSVPESV